MKCIMFLTNINGFPQLKLELRFAATNRQLRSMPSRWQSTYGKVFVSTDAPKYQAEICSVSRALEASKIGVHLDIHAKRFKKLVSLPVLPLVRKCPYNKEIWPFGRKKEGN